MEKKKNASIVHREEKNIFVDSETQLFTKLNAANKVFCVNKKDAQMPTAENEVLHPYPHPCVHQYWYIQ